MSLDLKPLNADAVAPNLQTTSVTFQPDDWNHRNKDGNVEKDVVVELSSVPSFNHDVSFFIVIKSKPQTHAQVRLSTVGLYNPNKPFWVEIGANFDFADGLKPNNFFGGVFMHKRDIRPLFYHKSDRNKPKSSNLGIFAGVYESKTISDGFHVFASLWFELQWQRISSQVDYSEQVRKDTMYYPRSALSGIGATTAISQEKDIRSHYLGVGLPFYFKEGNANVYFNPVIGLSNQPFEEDINNIVSQSPSATFARRWRGFYIFQFRLNEELYGLSFTGDVRGLLMKNSRPFVSLALSKKFDVQKFMEFSK